MKPPAKVPRRPSKFSPRIAAIYCGFIRDGRAFAWIHRQATMPTQHTALKWRKLNGAFDEACNEAVNESTIGLEDRIIDVAEMAEEQFNGKDRYGLPVKKWTREDARAMGIYVGAIGKAASLRARRASQRAYNISRATVAIPVEAQPEEPAQYQDNVVPLDDKLRKFMNGMNGSYKNGNGNGQA